jgi:sialate O-acetylesterase
MRWTRRASGVLALGLVLAAATGADADVRLPAIFGDHMVVQQDLKIPVWGWADPGESVTVTLGDRKASAKADADSKWRVSLAAVKAGGPLEMTVAGKNTIKIADVLAGDVWVCSGQSNMEMSVGSSLNAAQEIAEAKYPEIRLFTVAKKVSPTPLEDCQGSWVLCSPETVGGFSAVGYFFGRDLWKAEKVPQGLIHTSWGGTPAESWTTLETLRARFKPIADRYQLPGPDAAKDKAEYEAKLKAWEETGKDPGNTGSEKGYADPAHDLAAWKEIDTPGKWEDQGLDLDGAVWMRRDVEVPEAWAGKDLALSLGAIDDYDTTYFNGTKVGAIGPETPNWWQTPRKYKVPGALVKAGKATIAVRVFDNYLGGGMTGAAEDLNLKPEAGGDAVSLAGKWRYLVEFTIGDGHRPAQPQAPGDVNNPWLPSGLWNAMIQPIVPFGIRGAIWYQGESNAGRAYQYRDLFAAMIEDWRRAWGQGDFPFFFVQLANFTPRNDQPVASDWAELREAQTMTLRLPKTGMAVIIDIGDAADIHPKNKQDVGGRLALAARKIAYGEDLVYSGPMYKSMKVEDGKVRLAFDHTGGGPVAKGDKLVGFAVAGDDQKFVWADARIDGKTVLVGSPDVPKPAAVRYAWSNNPECNLYNKEGLPASPFRTDDWPGVTVNNQ